MTEFPKLDEGLSPSKVLAENVDWFGVGYGGELYSYFETVAAFWAAKGINVHLEVSNEFYEWPGFQYEELEYFTQKRAKPWEAKLPQDRPVVVNGFRIERRAASSKQRKNAKAARKQRLRCR